MSVNRYLPHVFVLPEDDANRQLANGFLLGINTKQLRILAEAGGWNSACERFCSDHVVGMRQYDKRAMILLIDFDGDHNRLSKVQPLIPPELRDRVFVLGVRTEPEALRQARGISYEAIGRAMADDCRNGTQTIWAHELLSHNERELSRLRAGVCAWLFQS